MHPVKPNPNLENVLKRAKAQRDKNITIGLVSLVALAAIAYVSASFLFNGADQPEQSATLAVATPASIEQAPSELEKMMNLFELLKSNPYIAAPILGIGAVIWMNGGLEGLFDQNPF